MTFSRITGVQGTPASIPAGGPGGCGPISIRQQSGDYTLQSSDIGARVESTGSSAQTFTVPTGIGTAGNVIELSQMGSGTLMIAAGAGVTINTPSGLAAAGQYATLGLVREPDGSWTLSGFTT